MPRKSALQEQRGESEKLTINLGYVDLGGIDLLVREGFYAHRSDFIRTAIRRQLEAHDDRLRKSADHLSLDLGLRRYGRAELEAALAAGEKLDIRVLGLVAIEDDVTIDLAREAIASITVLGALQARRDLKAALADRIR